MKIYNTLSRQKEEFQPLDPPRVRMYVCGITPYDETHLGHARAYVTFDVIRRFLEYSGYEVIYVQNITDIDDKIIKRSHESRVTSHELAEKYTNAYFEVMDKLNVKRADRYPKATEHIPEMVRWIGGLVDRGYAYVLEDGVYFEVDRFADYGKLSHRKKEGMEAGARVEVDEKKRNPLDFALWKKAKEGEPSWESPWGPGRPGWHIECSVMSSKYLGEQFDIHGGGMDLEFPHHENEIAQTESFTGKIPWVKYWIHNGFVNINKQKMSKSLGNFFTLREIFEKFDPMVVRFFLLMTHYRSPINYSDAEIDSVKEGFERIRKFIADLDFLATHPPTPSLRKRGGEEAQDLVLEVEDMEEDIMPFSYRFRVAMNADFNTAGAIAAIFDMIKFCRKTLDEGEVEKECLALMKKSVLELCEVLGLEIKPGIVIAPEPASAIASTKTGAVLIEEEREKIERLIKEREEARKGKDFKKADEIRSKLKEMGIVVEDTPYGSKWSQA